MPIGSRVALAVVSLVVLSPLGAHAHAEAGTLVDNVELPTLAGGKEKLLSAKARANVLVFFRPNHDRSLDALKQMARCEKDLAGKPVHWVAIVSSNAAPEEVRSTVAEAGIAMPVLVDQGDALYDRLGIRLHPMVAIADGAFKLVSIEMYRQVEYCDVVKGRIRVLLGDMPQAELDKVLNPEKSTLPGDDPSKKAMRDVHMAQKLVDLGQPDKAIERAKRALELAPVAAAYTVIGDAWARKGNCAEASKSYEAALKLDPGDAKAAVGQKGCAK